MVVKNNISALKKRVWKEFSEYIRLKNSDKDGYVQCYTCGKKFFWKEMQCGHGLGGRGNAILFDTEIVRPQCKQCNVFKGGNYDIFHSKLIEENGLEWFKDKLRQKHSIRKFSPKELEEMLEYYKNEVKKLKNDKMQE